MGVFLKKLLLISLVILPLNIYAANAIHHGPIGIMGDHFHKKGEWMVSLRLANMEMKKNILNGNSISAENILKQPNPFSKMPMMMKGFCIYENANEFERYPKKNDNENDYVGGYVCTI